MARWVWRNVACLGNKGRPAEGKTPRDNWVTANCHGLRELRSAADGQDDEVVVLTPLGLSMLEDAQGDENAHGEPGLRRQAAIPITPAQRRILEAIRAHMDAHGVPPTQKELGEALGLNPMTAREHLHHLQGRGALRLMKGRRRGSR
ncbi:MAG: hypothetical protein M5U26_19780 [Planctomycetota bacterium]|nr:hypothetical protein [Planctomycetota bacterium]